MKTSVPLIRMCILTKMVLELENTVQINKIYYLFKYFKYRSVDDEDTESKYFEFKKAYLDIRVLAYGYLYVLTFFPSFSLSILLNNNNSESQGHFPLLLKCSLN